MRSTYVEMFSLPRFSLVTKSISMIAWNDDQKIKKVIDQGTLYRTFHLLGFFHLYLGRDFPFHVMTGHFRL